MPDDAEMTKEQKRFLMRALWDSLVARKWTKDDLIDFGKAIFAKKSLKEMDEKTFARVFPFLSDVVADLGARLSAEAERQSEEAEKQHEEELAKVRTAHGKDAQGEAPEKNETTATASEKPGKPAMIPPDLEEVP